jgi:hypothetical protein
MAQLVFGAVRKIAIIHAELEFIAGIPAYGVFYLLVLMIRKSRSRQELR